MNTQEIKDLQASINRRRRTLGQTKSNRAYDALLASIEYDERRLNTALGR